MDFKSAFLHLNSKWLPIDRPSIFWKIALKEALSFEEKGPLQSEIPKNEGDSLILIKVKEILFFLDKFFKSTNVLLRNGACKPEKRISIKSKLKRTDA